MNAVAKCLGVNGRLIIVGAPADPLEIPAVSLIRGRRAIQGWPSGTSLDSQEAMAFSAQTGVRPMTEVYPLERAAEAYERMMTGKARFPAWSLQRGTEARQDTNALSPICFDCSAGQQRGMMLCVCLSSRRATSSLLGASSVGTQMRWLPPGVA